MTTLATTADVIDALGGTRAVAEIFDCHVNAVSNWRCAGSFPAHTFFEISRRIEGAGFSAPKTLWRFKRGAQQETAAC